MPHDSAQSSPQPPRPGVFVDCQPIKSRKILRRPKTVATNALPNPANASSRLAWSAAKYAVCGLFSVFGTLVLVAGVGCVFLFGPRVMALTKSAAPAQSSPVTVELSKKLIEQPVYLFADLATDIKSEVATSAEKYPEPVREMPVREEFVFPEPAKSAEPRSASLPAELPTQSCGTAVNFVSSPQLAAQQAASTGKLLFLLHVSGNFEDPNLT